MGATHPTWSTNGERSGGRGSGGKGYGAGGSVLGHGVLLSRTRAWLGDVKHGSDDLASVSGRQNPEGVGETSDDGEPSAVQVKACLSLTRLEGTVVPNRQA